ncbi:hypothetical protein ACR78Z_12885 [Sphingobacterium thalpophilum]|uniref:hypothetical protein n=1 Tax=Sphingobacterium TaxID=28453 RepID=UPI00257C8503|nr:MULTISPECIES: hypothetical protein [unclassified Sphingobacterium]
MSFHLGKKVEEIAKSKGYSQTALGKKVNMSKPGIASMYKRSGIDSDLLIKLTEVLDYDFFKHVYENESMIKYKEEELAPLKSKIEQLDSENMLLKNLVLKNDQITELQFKHIAELEEKLLRQK